jgi:hypothetical protein
VRVEGSFAMWLEGNVLGWDEGMGEEEEEEEEQSV